MKLNRRRMTVALAHASHYRLTQLTRTEPSIKLKHIYHLLVTRLNSPGRQ
jgi:hypothetical protein